MNQETAAAVTRMCEAVWEACPWAAPTGYQRPADSASPFDDLFKGFTQKP